MITVGIDMGSKTIKVVVLRDGEVIGRGIELAGFESREAAEKAFDAALQDAGISKADIDGMVATGAGRKNAPHTDRDITEVGGDAKGVVTLYPHARTVIDVGAEEGRAIRCNEEGKVLDFALNEKCAAGAGAFTEAMSRALEVSVEELGQMSLRSKNPTPMNAQCAVFAESEVCLCSTTRSRRKIFREPYTTPLPAGLFLWLARSGSSLTWCSSAESPTTRVSSILWRELWSAR